MSSPWFVVPTAQHHSLIKAAYRHRGYSEAESEDAARFCDLAARHGIRTHNGIKALHLDEHFGSRAGGCVPGAEIEVLPSRFAASAIWNANRKLGQSTAFAAMEEAIRLADQYGIGQVSVDNAFHYLWGGGYVMEAAQRGYLAYTNCTAALAEVVPFGGRFPTLGTNPHSWGFPTQHAVGFRSSSTGPPAPLPWAACSNSSARANPCHRTPPSMPVANPPRIPPRSPPSCPSEPTRDTAFLSSMKWSPHSSEDRSPLCAAAPFPTGKSVPAASISQ
jgi:L-2-hydroxycarboxylate dehydrogenase (NAD+)